MESILAMDEAQEWLDALRAAKAGVEKHGGNSIHLRTVEPWQFAVLCSMSDFHDGFEIIADPCRGHFQIRWPAGAEDFD